MDKQLEQLYGYLESNGYADDAKCIKEIKDTLTKSIDQNSLRRLVAMCNPRYLGNLCIKEFKDVYEWWDFLSAISTEAKKEMS